MKVLEDLNFWNEASYIKEKRNHKKEKKNNKEKERTWIDMDVKKIYLLEGAPVVAIIIQIKIWME